MKGALGLLFPDPTSTSELDETILLLNSPSTNWLDEIRKYLLRAILKLHAKEAQMACDADKIEITRGS